MAASKCTARKRVSKIVVEENKRKATFLNDDRSWFQITQVDGCLCRNEEAADWVIVKEKSGAVVIELKGRDVPHAVRQVLATAKFLRRRDPKNSAIAGLVVCRQRPSYSTSVQRFQTEFARAFRGPLHIVPSNRDYIFEAVLSFKGP
jgi:hypothetical protein